MASSSKRLLNELKKLSRDQQKLAEDSRIFFEWNESNLYQATALIIGPEDTPYANGFYLFDVTFPETYPAKPPKVLVKTTDHKARLHPNLYTEGKVCLSILGTWQGPGWSMVLQFGSVLVAIQSLLCENPITAEPGFEKLAETHKDCVLYKKIVEYENISVAVLRMLEIVSGEESSEIEGKGSSSEGIVPISPLAENSHSGGGETTKTVTGTHQKGYFEEDTPNLLKSKDKGSKSQTGNASSSLFKHKDAQPIEKTWSKFTTFLPAMKELFLKNYDKIYEKMEGLKSMEGKTVQSPCYGNKTTFNVKATLKKLENMKAKLEEGGSPKTRSRSVSPKKSQETLVETSQVKRVKSTSSLGSAGKAKKVGKKEI